MFLWGSEAGTLSFSLNGGTSLSVSLSLAADGPSVGVFSSGIVFPPYAYSGKNLTRRSSSASAWRK